jgi:hypothetical protein
VVEWNETVAALLMRLTEGMKNALLARLVASRQRFEWTIQSGLHAVSISEVAMNDFDAKWGCLEARMKLVPGKEVLSVVNEYLQSNLKFSLSPMALIEASMRSEVPASLVELLNKLDEMRTAVIPEQATLTFESG